MSKKFFIFFAVFIAAFLLRLYVSYIGNNYDYGSWMIVGSLVADGKNVYEETSRYSYGPVWALSLGLFKQISYLFYNDLFIFRMLIIFALSLADMAITIWLYQYIGSLAILLFLFNPISIYTSGFHNQFDNIGIAIALFSLRLIEKYKLQFKGYLLLGLSLTFKHIFLFLPLWLLISAKTNKQRLLSLIPVFIFFASFLPFLSSEKAIIGIWHNVFTYQRDVLYSFLPRISLLTPLIILCFIIPFGFLIKHEKVEVKGLLYLLLFVATLTSTGSQYVAIPLAAYVAINPLVGLLYTSIGLQNIMFHSMKLEMSLILAFQLSWLVFLRRYFPILKHPIRFICLFLLLASVIYSLPFFMTVGKNIYIKEKENRWFMQSLYSADKVFFLSKEKSKKPLVSENEIKGRFLSTQNNLGFVTIPFSLENPSEHFLDKGYKVTAKIQELGNPVRTFQETRTLSSGLTGEGILIGFPILADSNKKNYDVTVSTDVPKNMDYLTLNLSGNVQARYFLSRSLLNSPTDVIQFVANKVHFFLTQQNNISLLLQLYTYLWLILALLYLKFK